jgi:hypothetical protein
MNISLNCISKSNLTIAPLNLFKLLINLSKLLAIIMGDTTRSTILILGRQGTEKELIISVSFISVVCYYYFFFVCFIFNLIF